MKEMKQKAFGTTMSQGIQTELISDKRTENNSLTYSFSEKEIKDKELISSTKNRTRTANLNKF